MAENKTRRYTSSQISECSISFVEHPFLDISSEVAVIGEKQLLKSLFRMLRPRIREVCVIQQRG